MVLRSQANYHTSFLHVKNGLIYNDNFLCSVATTLFDFDTFPRTHFAI